MKTPAPSERNKPSTCVETAAEVLAAALLELHPARRGDEMHEPDRQASPPGDDDRHS